MRFSDKTSTNGTVENYTDAIVAVEGKKDRGLAQTIFWEPYMDKEVDTVKEVSVSTKEGVEIQNIVNDDDSRTVKVDLNLI